MSICRTLACGLMLSMLLFAYGFAQRPNPAKSDRPQTDGFSGKAIYVVAKSADANVGILDPEI